MSLELEKCMRVISDLVSFCHFQGAQEYDVKLKREVDGGTEMRVRCPLADPDLQALEDLQSALSVHRQREVEQNYWELSGETEFSAEVTLIGMMVDKATVTYEDGVLDIWAWRKK